MIRLVFPLILTVILAACSTFEAYRSKEPINYYDGTWWRCDIKKPNGKHHWFFAKAPLPGGATRPDGTTVGCEKVPKED